LAAQSAPASPGRRHPAAAPNARDAALQQG
jgi:hypothetical protein